MKFSFFSTIIFICALTSVSHAQYSAGIKAGGNFTNVLTSDETRKHKFIPGFHVGLLAQLDISEIVSLQTEAVYSVKGFKLESNVSSPPMIMGSNTVTVTTDSKVTYKY